MPQKTEAQQSFELVALTWGFRFDRDEKGDYINQATVTMFSIFLFGWYAALESKAKNA